MWKASRSKGQTILEYLLITTLVACLTFYALLGKNHMLLDAFNETNLYYDAGAKAIAGSIFYPPANLTDPLVQGTLSPHDPLPVPGGWCPWGSCIEEYQERECACPRPLFGGSTCVGSPMQTCPGGGRIGGATCTPTDCYTNGWNCDNSIVCPAIACGFCNVGSQWACISHQCVCTPIVGTPPCQDNGCGVRVQCPPGQHCRADNSGCEVDTCTPTTCFISGGVGNLCGSGVLNNCGDVCGCAAGLNCNSNTGTCCDPSTCTAAPVNCNSYYNSMTGQYETYGLTGCNTPCTNVLAAASCVCGDGFCADDPSAHSYEDCLYCPGDCGYTTCTCTVGSSTTLPIISTTGCTGSLIRVGCPSGLFKFCLGGTGGQTNCPATPSWGAEQCKTCDGGASWSAQVTNPVTGNPAIVRCTGTGTLCISDCPSCAGGVCLAGAACWSQGTCCIPNCTGRCGGAPDGCGGTCTAACSTGYNCVAQACVLKQCYQCNTRTCTAGTPCAWSAPVVSYSNSNLTAAGTCSGSAPGCGGTLGNTDIACSFGSYGASCP